MYSFQYLNSWPYLYTAIFRNSYCLFTAGSKFSKRKILNWAGLVWSSLYLCLTFINKNAVDRLFEKAYQLKRFRSKKYLTSPMILNNALWYCIAKSNDLYYYGYYSLFDQQDKIIFKSYSEKSISMANSTRKKPTNIELVSDNYYNIIPFRMTPFNLMIWDMAILNSHMTIKHYGFHFVIVSRQW